MSFVVRLVATVVFLISLTSGNAAADARLHVVGSKSVYAKAGLQTGDVIVSIDGEPVKSAAEASQSLYLKIGDGKKHRMKVRRSGKLIDLDF